MQVPTESNRDVTETRSIMEHISQIVAGDPNSVDLSISLVAAALQSYRHDSVLRPFPQMFITEADNEVIKQYQTLFDFLKSLQTVERMNWSNLTKKEQDFLAWICNRDGYSIKTCLNHFQTIKELTGHTDSIPAPNYIFEVLYSEEKNRKFQELKGSQKSIFAYHGSKLENFHSILNFGLNAHMSKNALFGEGTYLTSELSVAMTFCPTGQGWNKSRLGEKLGCIAVCEVIDDPCVKCQEKHENSAGQDRGRISGSEGGRIPEKYYVVQNNDLVRVKYLLIYAQKNKPSIAYSWFNQNRFALLMVSYLVLLLSVALLANKDLTRSIKKFFK